MTLTLTPLPGIPLLQPGDDLAAIVLSALQRLAIRLQDGDILVFAQKAVSKSEGRRVNLVGITAFRPRRSSWRRRSIRTPG